jgi:hypothetical protein
MPNGVRYRIERIRPLVMMPIRQALRHSPLSSELYRHRGCSVQLLSDKRADEGHGRIEDIDDFGGSLRRDDLPAQATAGSVIP